MKYLIPVCSYVAPLEALGLYGTCPRCGERASVNGPDHHTTPGRISDFHRARVGGACPGAGMAVTLEAAITRDGKLNRDEKRVREWVYRQEMACNGYDTITGEECWHPVCHRRRDDQQRVRKRRRK